MNDAGEAKTRGRLQERRRSQGPKGAFASASGGRDTDVAQFAGSQRGRGVARLSAADAQLIVLRGRYKEAAG